MPAFYGSLNHWLYPSHPTNSWVFRVMKKLATMAMTAFILLATARAGATTSPTFDLVCGTTSGARLHFRFDLMQKKWCVDRCDSVWAIDELSDSTIKLVTFSIDNRNNWTFLINRYTSTFSAIHRGYGDDPADKGECKAGPFSGFPTKRF